MNKAEIIRKLSKKAGIPDTETKKFLDIFLKHASGILKPGESLQISEVGLFQLRVGQIENSAANAGENFIYSDIIVFMEEGEKDLQEGEETIFNVPSGLGVEYQPIDSHFSLSIGKPVIPLKGISAEMFIPTSGSELRTLLESKVKRLIDEAVKIEGGKETETILLRPGEKYREIESQVEEEKVPDRSDFIKTREFENLSWDFGENLSEEIEEEETVSSPDKEIRREEVDWIGEKEEEPPKETEEPHFEAEEVYEENQNEEIFEDIIDEDIETTEVVKAAGETEIAEVPETLEEAETAEVIESFEAPTEENLPLESETPVEEKISEAYEQAKLEEEKEVKEEMPGEEPRIEEPILKNFQRVTRLTKEFETSIKEIEGEEQETDKAPKRITEVRGGFQKVKRTTAEFNFDLSGIKGLDEEEGAPAEEKSGESFYGKRYRGYTRRNKIPTLIIASVVVIVLAGIIFMYMKLKSENQRMADTIKQPAKVIERDYQVPVTYPYDSSQVKKPEDSRDKVKSTETVKSTDITKTAENIAGDVNEIRNPVNAERIESYIYKYPQGIVVQVSSWKSKSIAISEVKKFTKAGYTSFAEQTNVPGLGLYYRVRVGYFKTLNEAKEFANGNQ